MPKAVEKKLKAEAEERGYSKKRTGAYVYGNPAMQAKKTEPKATITPEKKKTRLSEGARY